MNQTTNLSDLFLAVSLPGAYYLKAPGLPSASDFAMDRSISSYTARQFAGAKAGLISDLSQIMPNPTSVKEVEILELIKKGVFELNLARMSNNHQFISRFFIAQLKVDAIASGIDLIKIKDSFVKDIKSACKGVTLSTTSPLITVKITQSVYNYEPTITIRAFDFVIAELKVDPYFQKTVRIVPAGPILSEGAVVTPPPGRALTLAESVDTLTIFSTNLKALGYSVIY